MLQTVIYIVVAVIVILGVMAFSRNAQAPQANDDISINQVQTEEANQVSSEPDSVVDNVQEADLSSQNLTSVPQEIFSRTKLQQLDLSDNQLSGSLPAEVRQLQNLQVLNLSNNQFTGVPAEVGQLSNLQVLDLSNNNLTGLPYELGNLSNLRTLNLLGNDYSAQDLAIIRAELPSSVSILVD